MMQDRISWGLYAGDLPQVDCWELIRQYDKLPSEKATIFAGEEATDGIRSSYVSWVNDEQIQSYLWSKVVEINSTILNIDVHPKCSMQYTQYSSEYNGFYDWHSDVHWIGGAAWDRKVSVVLQLSDGNDYEGGDFEFQDAESPDREQMRRQGSILVFPSYLRHRVTPITKGERRSLVAWFEGPRWR